ncbi:hypothetical protein A3D14_02765 [Candidatus Saccharibacteria bacterium RIFCSPHIGHO2_02_FULL_47_12]|nr:MAG: hypothetical protein A3D14_02765 [Candidatus Saccharibacteria bacterium RIFCSPHIGHO2_02_FULL_47_12]
MTNFAHGRHAEAVAAEYLENEGYVVLEQNYRTRWCEIDIVAEKGKRVYFTEVKYRQTGAQGGGLDYITPQKLKQMKFAADFWVQDHGWTGDYTLAAIELSGPEYTVENCIFDL